MLGKNKNIFAFFLIFYLAINTSVAQKNYILPEPQSITFPETEKPGFRLSKKTSLSVTGSSLTNPQITDLIKFIKNETGFEVSTSKQNKKSNIELVVDENIHILAMKDINFNHT